MKVSQFNRAKEIMETLSDLDRMKTNLVKQIDTAFTKFEDDPQTYSYNKKQIEIPLYPKANDMALALEKRLIDVINEEINSEKMKLNAELDLL